MTGLLAETFLEVDFVWASNLDFGFIEARKRDIVLTAITERIMASVPDDTFDLESFSEALLMKETQ
ncbi:MAG: hypothetical protein ACR2JI_16285 [Mycobacterium sp.]